MGSTQDITTILTVAYVVNTRYYYYTIIVCEVQQYKWRYSRPVYIHCTSCICGLLAMNQPQFCKFYFEMKMDSM